MKKILFAISAALMVLSCAQKPQTPQQQPLENSVVYEMNVRQYTPEGTFAAAQQELPRLAEMGVDILWLMPIYPIGVEGRKGELGSYYAVKNYCDINPEFGTLADFDTLSYTIHNYFITSSYFHHLPLHLYDQGNEGRTIPTFH